MVDWLATAITVVSVVVAAWGLFTAYRGRPAGYPHLAGLAVVEVLLLVQVGVAIAKLAGGYEPESMPTFIGYLIAAALTPLAAGALAVVERTRWGSTILGVGALVVPVLILRLQQIWNG